MDPATRDFARFRDGGDVAALGRVFDAVAPGLLSMALHLCRHAADAEDALQATFLVGMRKAEQFDSARPVAAWLAGILAGEVKNLERRSARRAVEAAPGSVEGLVAPGVDPAQEAQRAELVRRLRTRIGALPFDQRQVLLLQLEHGLQPAEIAEVLGLAPGTVRMRVHRGLQRLRSLLPAGLAAWLAGVLPARGLAAVRRAVLQRARVPGTRNLVAGWLVTSGVVMSKFVLVVVAILALGILVWLAPLDGTAPMVVHDSTRGASPRHAPRGKSLSGPIGAHAPTMGSAARRVAATTAGDLLVRVRLASTPAEGVEVVLVHERAGHLDLCATDAEGEARFASVPSGTVRVNFMPGAVRDVPAEIAAGSETVLEHELPLGGMAVGRTVDDVGRPVPHARIVSTTAPDLVHLDDGGLRPGRLRPAGRSDAQGTFRIPLLPGEEALAAFAPAHAGSPTQLLHLRAADPAAISLVLPRAHGSLHGVLRDGAGGPIAGARIVAGRDWFRGRARDGAEVRSSPALVAESDGRGAWSFDTLPLGLCRLLVCAQGHGRREMAIDIRAGLQRQDVELPCSASLVCVVRDELGRPVDRATVRLDRGSDGGSDTGRTDADGRCGFRGVTAGGVEVHAHEPGVGHAQCSIELRPGENHVCEVVLARPLEIRGSLHHEDGRPLAGWDLWLKPAEGGERRSPVRPAPPPYCCGLVDPDGRFVLAGLQPLAYTLLVSPPGAGNGLAIALVDEKVEPSPVPRQFVLPSSRTPTARVTGRVRGPGVDAATRVSAARLAGDETVRAAEEAVAADGTFSLAPLPPGRYRITVRAPNGLAPEPVEVHLAPHDQRDVGSMFVAAGARLVVRVLDAAGEAWRHAMPRIALYAAESEADEPLRGGFTARGTHLYSAPLPPGPVRLVVSDDSLFAWPCRVELHDGQATAIDLTVHAAVRCGLRFQFLRTTCETSIKASLTGAAGRRIEARTPTIPPGIDDTHPGCLARVALLPGIWKLEAVDQAGTRYAGEITVGAAVTGQVSPEAVFAIPRVR